MSVKDLAEPFTATTRDSCISFLNQITVDLEKASNFDEVLQNENLKVFFKQTCWLQQSTSDTELNMPFQLVIEDLFTNLKNEKTGPIVKSVPGIGGDNKIIILNGVINQADKAKLLTTYKILQLYCNMQANFESLIVNNVEESNLSIAKLIISDGFRFVNVVNSNEISDIPPLIIQKLPIIPFLINLGEKIQSLDFQIFEKFQNLLASYFIAGLWNKEIRNSILAQLPVPDDLVPDEGSIMYKLMKFLDSSISLYSASKVFTEFHPIGMISSGLLLKLSKETCGILSNVEPASLKNLILSYFQGYNEIMALINDNSPRKAGYSAFVQKLSGLCCTEIGRESLAAAMVHTNGIKYFLELLESSTTSTRVNGLSSIYPVFSLVLRKSLQTFAFHSPNIETYDKLFQIPHGVFSNITSQLEMIFEMIDNPLQTSTVYTLSMLVSLSFLARLVQNDAGIFKLNHAISLIDTPMSTTAVISYAIYSMSCVILNHTSDYVTSNFEKSVFDRKIPPVYERIPRKTDLEKATFSTFSLSKQTEEQATSQKQNNLKCCLKLLIFILRKQFIFLAKAEKTLLSDLYEKEELKFRLNYDEAMLQLIFTSALLAYRADSNSEALVLELFTEAVEISPNCLMILTEAFVSLSKESLIYGGLSMKVFKSLFTTILKSQGPLSSQSDHQTQLLKQIKPVLFNYLSEYFDVASKDSLELISILQKIGLSWNDLPSKSPDSTDTTGFQAFQDVKSGDQHYINPKDSENILVPLNLEYYELIVNGNSRNTATSCPQKHPTNGSQSASSTKGQEKSVHSTENTNPSNIDRNARNKGMTSPRMANSALNGTRNNNIYMSRTGQNSNARAPISPTASFNYNNDLTLHHHGSIQEFSHHVNKISSKDFTSPPIRRYSSQGQMNLTSFPSQPRGNQQDMYNDYALSSFRCNPEYSPIGNNNPSLRMYSISPSNDFKPNMLEPVGVSAQNWISATGNTSPVAIYSNFPEFSLPGQKIPFSTTQLSEEFKEANNNIYGYGTALNNRVYSSTYRNGVEPDGAYL
ncbi:hypothetical protein NADFUDRAFT_52268 [Nadsonia fulvescens var. elongata DSM 6958]|uniref:Uncharacterized protein n=1 Tax=Nadsonia fulvescens var. elongata DSM 6958 TaxID=857566 RepID=A0A1E3PIE7_9ASCO|nr:hypothetical protein NADFUDRAFT_52268 [Nadsonia fulvescens var. elongata DSM 6958]